MDNVSVSLQTSCIGLGPFWQVNIRLGQFLASQYWTGSVFGKTGSIFGAGGPILANNIGPRGSKLDCHNWTGG